ncbi:MAG: SIR2 family NAD-dependent protein deacylase [Candidatus Helarchaeota archaeon]
MDIAEFEKRIELAAKLIRKSQRIIALTGAGSSTESGIRDFRGPNGLWKEEDPMKWAHIDAFLRDPGAYWKRAADPNRGLNFENIEPNQGHLALAKLEKMGKLQAVITQNVDGLHQKAGNTTVIELHGSVVWAHCLDCNKQYKRADVIKRVKDGECPPLCTEPGCNGILKSNTILFGEALPQDALVQAYQLSELCDLMIVLGSTLVVYPAAQLPNIARNSGANLININLDPTEKDYLFNIVLNGKIGAILPRILEKYEQLE